MVSTSPPTSALAALAVMLVLAACGGSATRGIPGRMLIGAIEFEGNHEIDDDDLREGLALRRLAEGGQDFDDYLVGVDADRIRGMYLRLGYFRVKVRPVVVKRFGLARIRYLVTEGPRARLIRVEMVGLPADPHIDRRKLRKLIPLADGEPFDYEAYDLAKPALLAAVEDAGYAHARMEAELTADRVRDEAVIRLEFTPGPLAHFGRIELRGTEGEVAGAARARLRAREGARYSTTALTDSRDALYDLGRFATVRVEPDRAAKGPVVPVTITVIPAPAHELRLGGGVGADPTAYEVRGRASYRIAGWPRPLATTFLELRPAYVFQVDDDKGRPRIEAIANMVRQDLFRPFLRGEAEVSYEYRAVEAYTSYGPRTRLGLRTPLYRRIVEVAAGWQFRRLIFDQFDDAIDDPTTLRALGLINPYLLGFYEQSLFVDLRDNPIEPRLGLYSEIRVEEGTAAAGGDYRYLRLTPELRGYLPLGPVVLAARGRIGTIRGDLPVTERYFAGGASSQRGFPERRLAPTVTRIVDGKESTAVVGGGGLVESGVELRFPLGTIKKLKLGGVTFLDGADVTERFADLELGRQHWAAGAGVRLGTPIGPVRFDLGYRLNRTGAGEPQPGDHFAFHLSLGEAF